MRISGGTWRGRPILMPKSDLVRPTQDRVREALFNLIMQILPGARLLDLFAGSGAVGLDALSRGAKEARFLEKDRTVFTTLKKNLAAFGVPDHCARNVDALVWLGLSQEAGAKLAPSPEAPFDIVFADPPYLWAKENGFVPIASALVSRNLLKPGGFLISETDFRTDPEELPGYDLVRDRTYGKTRLVIWQRRED